MKVPSLLLPGEGHLCAAGAARGGLGVGSCGRKARPQSGRPPNPGRKEAAHCPVAAAAPGGGGGGSGSAASGFSERPGGALRPPLGYRRST